MDIQQQALELNRIARMTYTDPAQAFAELDKVPTSVELSFLRVAVIGLVHLHLKPERKPRVSRSKTAKP